jgi:hypothetical protein
MKKIALPLALVLLAGCAEVRTMTQAGVEQKIQYNDSQARFYSIVPCDMTIGAYIRTLNDVQQQAVWLLCGGDQQTHMTAEDVQAVQDFLELRARSQ